MDTIDTQNALALARERLAQDRDRALARLGMESPEQVEVRRAEQHARAWQEAKAYVNLRKGYLQDALQLYKQDIDNRSYVCRCAAALLAALDELERCEAAAGGAQ